MDIPSAVLSVHFAVPDTFTVKGCIHMSEVQIRTLASGSSGNSILISHGGVNILLDVGISAKQVRERLASVGLDISDISAAVISHEHIDHIRGAGVLSRRNGLKIMATEKTLEKMLSDGKLGDIPMHNTFSRNEPFFMGEMEITAVPTPHNAVEPSAFVVRFPDGKKLSIATDLGHMPVSLRNVMKGSGMLIMESNYDEEMLRNGPYPWNVKEQIMSPTGHLSNCLSAMTLRELVTRETKYVLLAHLSENNNSPETAMRTMKKYAGETFPSHLDVSVAERNGVGNIYRL